MVAPSKSRFEEEQAADIVEDHAFGTHSHPSIPSLAFSSFPPSGRQPAR